MGTSSAYVKKHKSVKEDANLGFRGHILSGTIQSHLFILVGFNVTYGLFADPNNGFFQDCLLVDIFLSRCDS
jgi:hypothetical protein